MIIMNYSIKNNIKKEVKFNRKDKWISTTWDVSISELPDAAKESINIQYPEYRIEDVDEKGKKGEK